MMPPDQIDRIELATVRRLWSWSVGTPLEPRLYALLIKVTQRIQAKQPALEVVAQAN